MKKTIFFLLFFPLLCLADSDIKTISAFVGGLNPNDMQNCQEMLDQRCRSNNTPFVAYQKDCVNVIFTNETSCQQNAAILQSLGFDNATYYQSFGNIDLFQVNHPADGEKTTYLVTRTGQLLSLTTDLQLIQQKTLQELQKKYPKVTLADIAFGDMGYENDPVKGTETLTLKQYLLSDGTMASRHPKCYAAVSYQFSMDGTFTTVLPITEGEFCYSS